MKRWLLCAGLVACGSRDGAAPASGSAATSSSEVQARAQPSELVAVIDPAPLGANAGVLGEPTRIGRAIPIQRSPIAGIAVTPDGKTAFSAAYPPLDDEAGDPGVRVWDLTTGLQRATIGHAIVKWFAATPDATTIAVVDPHGALTAWSSDGVPRGHANVGVNLRWVGLDATGGTAFTIDDTGVVASWDLAAGKQRAAMACHLKVLSAGGTASGQIAFAVADGALELVDAVKLAPAKQLAATAGFPMGIAFSRDGKRLVALDDNGGTVFDLVAGTAVRFAAGGVCALPLADGKRVVVSSNTQGQELRVVDLASGASTWLAPFHGDSRALAEAAGHLIAGTWDGAIRSFDLATNTDVNPAAANDIDAIGFASDGAIITDGIAISPTGDSVHRVETGFSVTHGGKSQTVATPSSVHVAAIDAHLAVVAITDDGNGPGQASSSIEDVELGASKPGRAWNPKMFVQALAIAPDDKVIAVGGDRIELYARGGTLLHTLVADALNVNGFAFTPDGKRVVVATESDGLQIWDAATGSLVKTLIAGERGKAQGSTNAAFSVAMSPDGARFASGHRDGTLSIWDREGNPLGTAHRHHALILHLAFSPDGSQLATADQRGQVWRWPLR